MILTVIYTGKTVKVSLHEFKRPEKKFDSVDELKKPF